MSAKKRILKLMKSNVGRELKREELAEAAQIVDWMRLIRSMRSDEGYQIETTKDGYCLVSLEQVSTGKQRESISTKLRYQVLQRDGSKCQRCGRDISDGVKLAIDHKKPVDWGGKTELDNLWTLCTDCNGGKKNWFSDHDAEQMKQIMAIDTGYQRVLKLFELSPNKFIPSSTISLVAGIQDWPRTIRDIRSKHHMDIVFEKSEDSVQGYRYNLG